MQTSCKLHFGIGNHEKIDSIRVIWPNQKDKSTIYSQLNANNNYLLKDDGSVSSLSLQSEKISVYLNPFTNVIAVITIGEIKYLNLQYKMKLVKKSKFFLLQEMDQYINSISINP